jgi:glutamate synthase domain-containing protein 1
MERYLDDRTYKIPSGCGVVGIMNTKGNLFSGDSIIVSICNMLERGNGLGSGFAGYGIYPEYKDFYCFHIMYEKESVINTVEEYIQKNFKVVYKEPIPSKFVKSLKFIPILFRYFLKPKEEMVIIKSIDEKEDVENDFVVNNVMFINKNINSAFVFSSGKNMGIFKGVGNPDEIAEFFKINEYKGYIWTAHNRFPTNSVAWWGGAHPFGILDWSVIHNGEISSYGINRRYLENFSYYCTLSTDTEVIAYLFDLLVRKHKLSYEYASRILSSPFWSQIEREDFNKRDFYTKLRIIYGPALLNGPFAVIVANTKVMMGLNDRTKLRPLVAGQKGDMLYIASEESAIRCISKDLDKIWMPGAGNPVIGRLKD